MITDFFIIMLGVAMAYAVMGLLTLAVWWIRDIREARQWKRQGNRPHIVCPADCLSPLP